MNVLIAPNSFKGANNARELADAIKSGLAKANPNISLRLMPLADGGEFSLELLMEVLGGKTISIDTIDPLGRPITASYGITDKNTAIIELAKASGYERLTKEEMNPLITSTYGTGLLIKDALNRGCRDFLISLGGSATVDGGAGILEALGVRFLDKDSQPLPHGGGNLIILDSIDISELSKEALESRFTLLCDVKNPLLGAYGAAMVFAPQKGAGALETLVLERSLKVFGEICEFSSDKSLVTIEGSGAAGGVPTGMCAFLNTEIISGINYILELIHAKRHIEWADVVITAEGSLDFQTFGGKAPAVLAQKVKEAGKKIICIAGSIPHRAEHPDEYFDALFSIQNKPMTLEESIAHTLENIKNTAFEIGRLL